MLTKALLRYKFRGRRIEPAFIKPENESLGHFVAQLIDVFKDAVGSTRQELLEQVKPLIDAAPCANQVARGFEKLLLDRSDFDTAPNEELTVMREQVFEQSAHLLRNPDTGDPEAYMKAVGSALDDELDDLQEKLYGDLPDYQCMTRFKSISTEHLLHRYNSAQVQGLLMRSGKIEVVIHDPSPGALRQLFKYLRFHQLLANVTSVEGGYRITIDGPLNLFYQTQKYGMSLALFFPALLHQPGWSLQAEVQMQKRRYHELILDESTGIKPYSHRYLNYVPEEVLLFVEMVKEGIEGWSIRTAENFLPLEGEYYSFPDFELAHDSGLCVALELFHPWHASHLTHRLEQLRDVKGVPLVLGISRELLKNTQLKDALDDSDYYSEYGFLFRSMPSQERLGKVLRRVLAGSECAAP